MNDTPLARRLASVAQTVDRLAAVAVADAVAAGAVVVDIRSSTTRERDGAIEGSVHVPLTVLPWRLDPGGAWRTPHVPEGARVVLVCDHGCASLLAAAELRALGVDASDVVGGIDAWAAAGLPLVSVVDPPVPAGTPLGMEPPLGSLVRSGAWTGRPAGT